MPQRLAGRNSTLVCAPRCRSQRMCHSMGIWTVILLVVAVSMPSLPIHGSNQYLQISTIQSITEQDLRWAGIIKHGLFPSGMRNSRFVSNWGNASHSIERRPIFEYKIEFSGPWSSWSRTSKKHLFGWISASVDDFIAEADTVACLATVWSP